MTAERIGFIGTGVMGEPMCRNLARKHDGPVTAYDLDPAPLERLTAEGALVAPSLPALAEAADLIFLSLPSGREVRAVCLGEGGLIEHLPPGRTVVDTSTAPPALAREIEGAFAPRYIAFADAPVARTRQAAIDGTLSIMVGGDAALVERLRPLLGHIAQDVTHCGPAGSGQAVKILNNMILFQNVRALAEGLAIARRQGIEPGTFLEAVGRSSGNSFALQNHGMKAILEERFPEGAFPVTYAMKDLDYALDLAQESGVDAEGAALVKALFAEAIESGLGARYHPVIATLIGRKRPTPPEEETP
ncbi:MAG: NAD(P)-dependent oxidoreductase [Rhodospirillales bacterium]|nr:NAD(P)-dependent oxidoreductase [Rhodospirillales bacterium]MDE0379005.1 NAD(P)-dependent oxidoreductase [Rhodospirillales bacterium]